MKDDYTRSALVARVIDGDTLELEIDNGFHTGLKKQRLRLLGINCPELNTPEGQAAKEAVRAKVEGKQVVIRSHKDADHDSFGRWLCEVWIGDESLNDWLVTNGHAVRKDYK